MSGPSPVGLSELRQVEEADVYVGGERAATLKRTPDGVAFRYLSAWQRGGGRSVASTLPLSAASLVRPGGGLPAYFAGLLPEGRRLGAIVRQLKTSADDELSVLLAVGTDTIGDVQVVPAGVAPQAAAPWLDVTEIPTTSFAELLQQLGIQADRVGLPGVQDKVSGAMIAIPIGRRGASFILKLNPREFPHLVQNEAFFLRAAATSGLRVVNANLVLDRVGLAGLLVERFDRVVGAEAGPGLAVEDGCQALGLPPADKYRVSSEDVLRRLSGLCQAPLVAAREFLQQVVFAYLAGNGDAHAKNFSILRETDGEWRPTPAYDLPSSQPYGDTTMALSIAGKTTGDLGAADFVSLGSSLGLPERVTRRILRDQAQRAEMWLPGIDELPFGVASRRKLMRTVAYRRDRLSSRR